MSANVVNQVAYLRTTRLFPEDVGNLVVELNRSYIDIANAVNNRIIGIFPTNRPAITGESWFFTSQKQQSVRQVYKLNGTSPIAHGISTSQIYAFAKGYGTFTDGTNFYGISFGSNVAVAGQVTFYLTSSNIVILSGAGAPSISSGMIVIEWISDV